MTQRITLNLIGTVPIPVGRAVEVVIFMQDVGILSSKIEPNWKEPLLVDLESGISYGRDWHYGETVSAHEDLTIREPVHPVHQRSRGTIVATRIVSSGNVQHFCERTTLVIDIEAPL